MQRLIRKLKPEDLIPITEIEQRAFTNPWPAEAFYGPYFEYARILELEGKLCGYIFFHVIIDEAVILNFAIDPAKQGQGHGKYLLVESLKELNQSGCTHFYLDVRESNETAIKLYEKQGFCALGRRKHYYSNPDEDAIMMGLVYEPGRNNHDPRI